MKPWPPMSEEAKRAHAVQAGTIVRPTACEECGAVGPVEGIHADYGKPLDVRHLCRRCTK